MRGEAGRAPASTDVRLLSSRAEGPLYHLLFFLLVPVLLAQEAAPPETPASTEGCRLEGMVTNLATGAPVRRAQVMAFPMQSAPGQGTALPSGRMMGQPNFVPMDRAGGRAFQPAMAETDAGGRFAFSGLAPGRYRVAANKQGFLSQQGPMPAQRMRTGGNSSVQVTLVAGESARDVALKLVPTSALSGQVTDEHGDPVIGAQVSLLRQMYMNGKRQLTPMGANSTDDRGQFRIHSVAPGRYYVLVQHRDHMRPRYMMPMPRMDGPRPDLRQAMPQSPQDDYAPLFYPNSLDEAGATPVIVEPGAERTGVDLRLQRQRTVTVKIRVQGMPASSDNAPQFAHVMLQPKSPAFRFMGSNVSMTNGQRGEYMAQSIQPGSYVAVAFWQRDKELLYARQPVEVGESNIDDLTLTLAPGVTLSGTFRFEGDNPPQSGPRQVWLTPGGGGMGVMGMPMPNNGLRGEVGEDGKFSIANVPPGIWDIGVNPVPPEGHLKSMMLGTQDVLRQDMEIGSGAPPPLDIVVSTRAGVVEGTVQGTGQQAAGGAMVLLAPQAEQKGVSSLFKFMPADAQGRFRMTGVTPGKYRLYAFLSLPEVNTMQDPEFLKPLESRSTPLVFEETSQHSVTLSAIPPDA